MNIVTAIAELASADASVLAKAAAELYRTGRATAEAAVAPWAANLEIAALLFYPDPSITVGIAVPPVTFAAIRAACGNPPLSDVPPEQDAQEFELHFPGGVSLDVLTSRDPSGSGAIARYLQKFDQGIQQVEFRCKDVDRAVSFIQECFRIAPIYAQTRPGANGTRINFFLASAPSGKCLIELYESPASERAALD